jgi:hypothetical protein
MASLLLPDEQTLQPLLPLDDPDKLPPALQPDPRAEALGQLYREIAARTEKNTQHGIWDPNNPVGTETLQSAGMPKPTTYAGSVGQFIDPATGKLTDQGKARLNDNPALGFDTGGLSGGGLLGGLKAYHGSPHKFDAFSDHAIGTGEGAQAYGYGHYLAENEGVARSYRDQITNQKPDDFTIGNATVTSDDLTRRLVSNFDMPTKYAAATLLRDMAAGRGWDEIRASNPATPRFTQAIDWLQSQNASVVPRSPGHMYEVNVAADPEKFLHWDKPLKDQPEVYRKVEALVPPDLLQTFRFNAERGITGGNAYHNYIGGGDPAGASAALKEAGIPGIRYLDQGSRGAGDGTHNAVVFDPSLMEIIRRYGIAGLLGGAAATGASD